MAMWESFKDGVSSFGKLIQNVVGKIGGWFAEAWNTASDTATRIFTRVGETISGIFSGVVSGIKSLINGAIGGINKVIGITNKLPGVNIPKSHTLHEVHLTGKVVLLVLMRADEGN